MVDTILTDQLIEAGKTFVEKLDEEGLKPTAAFWFYFPESETWKLVIAEEAVGTEGPRHVYEQIQRKVLAKLPEEPEGLSLFDVTLRKPDAEIVTLVRKVVSSRPGIGGIRLTNSVVDGTFIEAAYIYRVT